MPHRRKSGSDTIVKFVPLALILLAFGLQLGYLAELQAVFPGRLTEAPFCGVDAQAHLERANGLLSGYLPGRNTFYFIPLYPLYLATLIKFFGNSLRLPIYLQILLQLPGLAALYGIGRLTFSRLTGLLALLGMATYNYYIFYVACFDQVLLTIPFFTLAIFFLLKYHQRLKPGWLWPAGISLAVAALSRPTILVVFPAIILWFYLVRRSRPTAERSPAESFLASSPSKRSCLWLFGRDAVFLILPFIILVSPITWHNYRVSGRFILLSDNFGVNFFTGNNPDATGLDSLAHAQSQPAVLRFIETNARVEAGETTLTAEVLRYITRQPRDWLTLTATKTWLWFGEADEPLVSPYFPLTVRQARTLARLPLEWQAVALVALLGLLLVPHDHYVRPRLGLLWLIYGVFSLGTIAFFIQLRFRLPLAPFVMLMATALLTLAPRWRQHSGRYWTALLVLLLCYPLVPGLWIFILIFVGLGLGLEPFRRRAKVEPGQQPSLLMITAAIALYLIAGGVWLRAEALSSDVSQRIDHYLGPPLVGNGVLGQTFKMDCDGLDQIEVTLGTFSHQGHDQPVTFYLASDPSGQEILFSQTFEGALVRDYRRQIFSFPPILDSAGRTFFFFMASPTSTLTNALTARGYADTPVDRYPGGSAYVGELGRLQRLEADFAFGAYCDLSWRQKLAAVLAEPLLSP